MVVAPVRVTYNTNVINQEKKKVILSQIRHFKNTWYNQGNLKKGFAL